MSMLLVLFFMFFLGSALMWFLVLKTLLVSVSFVRDIIRGHI